MGAIDNNRTRLTGLVRKAAAGGAKIAVLPECAVTGYMDPGRWIVWTSGTPDDGALPITDAAQAVPGPATRHFAALSRELGIYLVVPLAEKADGRFYNTQVLFDPRGETVAHHRKQALWPPGDDTWMTRGNRPVQVADSPYGRLGLMVCYDWNVMPKKLKEAGADIVLYSVGWYGPGAENWFRNVFPRWCVIPNGFAVVAANWSAEPGAPGWPGHGHSCVIAADGTTLAMTTETRGNDIVFADLPLPRPEDYDRSGR
jgi:predicted amidohydrolase